MRAIFLVAAAALVLATAGCGPKVVREGIFKSEKVEVELRRIEGRDETPPPAYEHPATIAGVRLVHILASLEHEDTKDTRRATIRTEHVYDLAEGISHALAKATPDDEVAAVALAHDRRMGIFSDERVTAFRCFLKDGLLVFEFFAIEEDYKKEEPRSQGYEIPLELPAGRPSFRLAAGTAQTLSGPRRVLVDWRDPFFRKPVNLSLRYGEVRRRTVLMEAEQDEEPAPPEPTPPAAATDAQIRALDELDASRRAGLISEPEFQRRRRLVLQGRLQEAGYGESESRP